VGELFQSRRINATRSASFIKNLALHLTRLDIDHVSVMGALSKSCKTIALLPPGAGLQPCVFLVTNNRIFKNQSNKNIIAA